MKSKKCRRLLIKDSHISYGMESYEVDNAWKNMFTLKRWGDQSRFPNQTCPLHWSMQS